MLTESLSLIYDGKLHFNGLVDSWSIHLSIKLPGIVQLKQNVLKYK